MNSSSEAFNASSPVPINTFKYPLPPMVMTASICPSETVRLQSVILNMLELESTSTG